MSANTTNATNTVKQDLGDCGSSLKQAATDASRVAWNWLKARNTCSPPKPSALSAHWRM